MKTLIEALAKKFPDSSRRTLKNWLSGGRIYVDGVVVKQATVQITEDQEITLGRYEVKPIKGIRILYEDSSLVVIHKPFGLLSFPLDRPGATHALGLLRHHLKAPHIRAVHRLDRETSGVMVFAKSEGAYQGLDELFEGRKPIRTYIAVTEGHLQEDEGVWESRVIEGADYSVSSHPNKGKKGITHFKVIKRTPKLTHLRLNLETGRKHQIRVHCKEAGHPIVGDKRYGAQFDPLDRLALHAHKLAFIHPISGKEMHFTAPLPRVFQKVGMAEKDPY